MLTAENLTKKYGDNIALNKLNLTIKEGEIFALLGQNGAGKTTTINLFLGFIEPTDGELRINNISVTENTQETKKHVAYIPETVMLYPNLSGLENLKFFSSLAGFKYSAGELTYFLTKAGLQAAAHNKDLGGYSKGMRQKVGIAIAIAKKAKVLLLDEPTSGLDPKASNEFSQILKELSADGTAILMATHDIFRAREVASHIGIMKQGNLVTVIEADKISANELENLYLQTV
ncbi:ABC transporter ATP-binding protein [Flavobacterium plurextorum]|uniref:ABC transporter ATP-binding protein n=1 Tax=Flavobacterium plurextorum TaxID=1114867 RepID=A0ABX4CZU4_9FLAO|nr:MULTISPECIES: ATP-binding cassette domain-containing protein [Flavobacterium]OXB10615.1 ABC transporter ATP-binding protein [Flavobacterium plurextorum]PIF70284.1 ABC-2 type transport system ATP-binding protein [Flavobacterium sp. 2]RXM48851.1 ABC transporter ATP-binding protein [Flavobacterium sp. YO12]UUW07450.1 ATP-binding cassette domain-containing protein [Flavobacterium plurextorum]